MPPDFLSFYRAARGRWSTAGGAAHERPGHLPLSTALAKLENATKMLAEVRDATDAKKLMAMASAAEHYARKAKLGEDAIDYAHTIKIDAERMLGRFLKDAEKHPPGPPRKIDTTKESIYQPPSLADLGVSLKLSSESQALDRIAAERPKDFEAIRSRKKTVSRVRREIQRAEVRDATDAKKLMAGGVSAPTFGGGSGAMRLLALFVCSLFNSSRVKDRRVNPR